MHFLLIKTYLTWSTAFKAFLISSKMSSTSALSSASVRNVMVVVIDCTPIVESNTDIVAQCTDRCNWIDSFYSCSGCFPKHRVSGLLVPYEILSADHRYGIISEKYDKI